MECRKISQKGVRGTDFAEYLTESPCLRRVRRLERDGLVERYQAMLNRDKLGFGCQVFVSVVMRREDRETIAEFERQVTALPQVVEAHRLFGESDYLLRVAVADVEAYQRFYSAVLTGLPGIESLTSHLTMKRVKEDRGLPVTDESAGGGAPLRSERRA